MFSSSSSDTMMVATATNLNAINNCCVGMMMRGQFQHAVNTFQSALALLEIIPRVCRAGDVNGMQCAHKVSQGHSRHASCLLSTFSSECLWEKGELPYFSLREVDSDDFFSLKAASIQNQPYLSYTAVLLRETCSNANGQHKNYSRETAAILYNFALACHLLALSTCSTIPSNAHFAPIADEALMMAHAILTNILGRCKNPAEDLESVLLDIMVLSFASRTLYIRNRAKAGEAEEARQIMLSSLEDEAANCLLAVEGNVAAAA